MSHHISHRHGALFAILLTSLLIAGCVGSQGEEGPVGPAGPPGPSGPVGPAGEDATASQVFVGTEVCAGCHEEIYEKFALSGHPYKLTKIENGQPPSFPYDDRTGGVPEPPEGYTWDDISYTIGGYGWKVRFIDQRGFIITGDEDAATQYNFANDEVGVDAGWVPYHAGEDRPYDCGACHTTGYSPDGNQDGLQGIIGTWAFPGIQCEECHGPGGGHAQDPPGIQMVIDRDSQLCGSCHIRDNPAQIDADDGFVLHHEQFEDLFNSKHFALDCVDCHDPHASTLFDDPEINPNNGIRQTCDTCHWQNAYQNNSWHINFEVSCIDCHMPPMGKSAVANPELYLGDIHSHLFSINPDPEAPQFTEDGAFALPYINLTYACKHCHNGEVGQDRDLEELAEMADGYHTPPQPTPEPALVPPEETPTPEAGADASS